MHRVIIIFRTVTFLLLGGFCFELIAGEALKEISKISRLSAEEAATELPVCVEATVTGVTGPGMFFVYDETGSIFVFDARAETCLKQRQRIRVEGTTHAGHFAPLISAQRITFLGEGSLPLPIRPSYARLASGVEDCEWAEISGIVRSAKVLIDPRNISFTQIEMTVDGNLLLVEVYGEQDPNLSRLVDSEVTVRGNVSGQFNSQRQWIGPRLAVTGFENVILNKAAPEKPFTASTSQLMRYGSPGYDGHRVSVSGVVTFRSNRRSVVIQDNGRGLFLRLEEDCALEIGDVVRVLGFPSMGIYSPKLDHAEVVKLSEAAPPPPVPATAPSLMKGDLDASLVEIEGQLLEWLHQQDKILVLRDSNYVFTAHLPQTKEETSVRIGSRVKLTGICQVQEVRSAGATQQVQSFRVLLRSPNDIRVLEQASWWNPRRLLWTLTAICSLTVVCTAWIWLLRRQVRHQSALVQHQTEHRVAVEERMRIAREFHDTLEQELTGISLQLKALEAESQKDPSSIVSGLRMTRRMLHHCHTEARRSILNLRSHMANKRGLAGALQNAVARCVRPGKLQIETVISGQPFRLPPAVELNLLRIGEEGLANAVRHANAKHILLEVVFGSEGVTLKIQDDGIGFDFLAASHLDSGHFGLMGMRERADQLGAEFSIQSAAGSGTTITVTLLRASYESNSDNVGGRSFARANRHEHCNRT